MHRFKGIPDICRMTGDMQNLRGGVNRPDALHCLNPVGAGKTHVHQNHIRQIVLRPDASDQTDRVLKCADFISIAPQFGQHCRKTFPLLRIVITDRNV